MKYLYYLSAIVIGVLYCSLQSCQEDNFSTDSSIKLDFSLDTLTFDTVFTSVGSATRTLVARNTSNSPIQISKIYLENGSGSKFRMNVDGYAVDKNGNIAGTNTPLPAIPVAAKDSVYIFMEVTVDPDEPLSVSPFVIHEQLNFETNGNKQQVTLEAFGQNANYIPSRNSAGTINRLTCDFQTETWDDPKPYVIYGILLVDSCELVLPAGTQVYVHGGLQNREGTFYNDGLLYVEENGTLRTEGTLEQPVVFQGDRLEEDFDEVRGQWSGIRLAGTQKAHELNYTTVKNSIVGVRVDSAATLNMKHTILKNTANTGLIGYQATIHAENCLIAQNSAKSVQLELGGEYDFKYCTFNNQRADDVTLILSNVICQESDCGACRDNDMNATFTNCIIMGSKDDGIAMSNACSDKDFKVNFYNSVIRIQKILETRPNFYADYCPTSTCHNYKGEEPLFIDWDEGDFHLDSLSFAANKALPIPSITLDLEHTPRSADTPDIGCYESEY